MKPASVAVATRPWFLITAFFLLLLVVLALSLSNYWESVLQPRLRTAANTQAQILAQSQAAALAVALQEPYPLTRERAVSEAIHRILLTTDPTTGRRFVRGFSMQVDYDLVPAPQGSLDFTEGETDCADCYLTEAALIGRGDELLGVASFHVGDGFFLLLSQDMQRKLYTESVFSFALLVVVWILILILFNRLNRAKELVEASDLAKTRFMANISHELRTPLNAILGYTQLYQKDKVLMESHGGGIQTIDQSARHLLLMINDVLDFSKADTDQLSLNPQEVPLAEFLDGLVDMSRVRARLKDIAFVHERPDRLPGAVMADPTRLRQVLLNLLNNAIKFTSKGSVVFRVSCLGRGQVDDADSMLLRFDVCDTGIGIAKDQCEAVFLPFQQVDNDITRSEGTGLGLTISRKLVDLMGGHLNLESVPGKGSTFWFALALPVVEASQSVPREGERTVVGHVGRRRRLLSVDDNAYNRDVMRHTLEQWGFEVEEAADGGEALERVRAQRPDLVFMDLIMPGMDGYATLQAIHAVYPDLSVIAVTASIQLGSGSAAWAEAGFADHLIKPLDETALLNALQSHLDIEWIYEEGAVQGPRPELLVPPAGELEALRDHARRHNILDLRQALETLAEDARYRPFVETLEPLVRGYRFKQLIERLDGY